MISATDSRKTSTPTTKALLAEPHSLTLLLLLRPYLPIPLFYHVPRMIHSHPGLIVSNFSYGFNVSTLLRIVQIFLCFSLYSTTFGLQVLDYYIVFIWSEQDLHSSFTFES